MIAVLAKIVDWVQIQVTTLPWEIQLRSAQKRRAGQLAQADSDLEAALEILKRPDFLPADSTPARVEFHPDKSRRHFRFPTPRRSGCVENDMVWGCLYQCTESWRERPVMVLLHGGGGDGYRTLLPAIAGLCNRAGFNAATLEGSYCLHRRPRRPPATNGSSTGYVRLAENMAQGVSEIRALTGWLLAQGCPSVGLWGISLGERLAGLTACCDARLAAVVMAVPGVRMSLPLGAHVFWPRLRAEVLGQRAAFAALDQTALNLATIRPVIAKERILLLEAIHDLCVGSGPLEKLWQAWERPEIWRLPRGHATFPRGSRFIRRVLCWLTPRFERLETDGTSPPNHQRIERTGAR